MQSKTRTKNIGPNSMDIAV